MFQLNIDTSEFIALAMQSEHHRWVAEVDFGRLLCSSRLFEDIVKIIATTNTTWAQTKRLRIGTQEIKARGLALAQQAEPEQADDGQHADHDREGLGAHPGKASDGLQPT